MFRNCCGSEQYIKNSLGIAKIDNNSVISFPIMHDIISDIALSIFNTGINFSE
jgi:hypothetical protein